MECDKLPDDVVFCTSVNYFKTLYCRRFLGSTAIGAVWRTGFSFLSTKPRDWLGTWKNVSKLTYSVERDVKP